MQKPASKCYAMSGLSGQLCSGLIILDYYTLNVVEELRTINREFALIIQKRMEHSMQKNDIALSSSFYEQILSLYNGGILPMIHRHPVVHLARMRVLSRKGNF